MKIKWFILILQVLKTNGFFLNVPFGPRIRISEREQNTAIKSAFAPKSLNGFYGLIGPDLIMHNKTSLFELFTGDGIVQGVFFENGQITFVKHFIRTDKLKYENINGRISENIFVKLIIMFLATLNMMPNILGVANTALLNINKKVYALYERDAPYLLNVDFENRTIDTIHKTRLYSMKSFSAHSKFSDPFVETLDYHVLGKYVDYLVLTENMEIMKKVKINTRYLPVVHDFVSTDQATILCDAPIVLDILSIFKKKLPVRFDTTKKTYFYYVPKHESKADTYTSDRAFYIFHYARAFENEERIELFGAVYENLDFNELNIEGRYRKIILHKKDKRVTMESNPVLETMNLDFPIQYGDKTVLRSIENNIINGFIICKDLDVVKQVKYADKFICGEPALINDTLVFFANDIISKCGFLMLLNLDTYEKAEIPISDTALSVGFHSLFLEPI
jgi:carotenoid cleavage dioxygenase-like enzyme